MSNMPSSDLPGLGRPVKECRLSPKKAKQIILLTMFSAGMALVCWLPAIFETNESPTTRIGISFLGLFVSSPMFVGIYQLFRLGGISLSLYENGLVFRQRRRNFTTTWDEIDSYILENACRITKKNGEVIEFGLSMEGGIDDVIRELQKQTEQRLLPQMKTALQSGSSVQFKGLKPFGGSFLAKGLNHFARAFSGFSVDSQGIAELEGGNRIAWKDVKDYGVSQEAMSRLPVDVFYITDGDTRLSTRLGLLNNAPILLKLCHDLTGFHQKDGG
jgi:hypothetical protein